MTLKLFPPSFSVNRLVLIATFVLLCSALATAQTYSNLDTLSGWQSCGGCAGANGVGPNTPRSLGITSSPSVDGSALRFSISPTQSYSNALWYKSVSPSGATHYAYDFYVFFKSLTAPQALEFDVMQGNGGRARTFGTECKPAAHLWKIWGNSQWYNSVNCSLAAGKWNHVIWEFSRASGGVTFVSVTVNGVKHYVNRTFGTRSTGATYLHATVQLDGNVNRTAYSIWVDKLTLAAF